jgi:hypothetical protein
MFFVGLKKIIEKNDLFALKKNLLKRYLNTDDLDCKGNHLIFNMKLFLEDLGKP